MSILLYFMRQHLSLGYNSSRRPGWLDSEPQSPPDQHWAYSCVSMSRIFLWTLEIVPGLENQAFYKPSHLWNTVLMFSSWEWVLTISSLDCFPWGGFPQSQPGSPEAHTWASLPHNALALPFALPQSDVHSNTLPLFLCKNYQSFHVLSYQEKIN